MRRALHLLSALLLVLLFLGGPDRVPLRFFRELWNLGHVVAFALWSVLLLTSRWAAPWPWRKQGAAIAVFSLLFGLLSETTQVWFARSPDVADLARDFLGAGVALAFFAPARLSLPLLKRRLLQAGTLAGLAAATVPFALAAADDLDSRLRFPLLADFESPLETGRWEESGGKISRAVGLASHGVSSLRIDLSTADYSGGSLRYFPGDWRGYERLRLDLYNPGPGPVEAHLRIHDRHHRGRGQHYHDRFNHTRLLPPGWSPVVIALADVAGAPRGRQMDMSAVEGVGIFVMNLSRPRSLAIDHMRLE